MQEDENPVRTTVSEIKIGSATVVEDASHASASSATRGRTELDKMGNVKSSATSLDNPKQSKQDIYKLYCYFEHKLTRKN